MKAVISAALIAEPGLHPPPVRGGRSGRDPIIDLERNDRRESAEDARKLNAGILGGFARLFTGAVIGKVLGLVRELALAALFGTGTVASALRASQTATLIPAQFVTGETLSAGLVPLLVRYRRDDPARATALFRAVSVLLFLFSAVATIAIVLGARAWASILFPGFSAAALNTTVQLLGIMALGIPFYVQSAMFWYWEMACGGYALAAARPAVQNLGMLLGIVIAWQTGNPLWLAWGFTAAYVALCALSPIWLSGTLRGSHAGRVSRGETLAALSAFGREVRFLLLLPILFQAGIAIERILASLLGDATVASVDYAKVLVETGLAVFALPLGLASVAELSRTGVDSIRHRISSLLPLLLALSVPVSAALVVHGPLVVDAFYARGAFDAESVRITSQVLIGLGVGLWAQLATYVLAKGMSAQLRNREMVRCMAIGLVVATVVQLLLWRSLGALALGLGVSVGAIVQLTLVARAVGIGNALVRHCSLLIPLAAFYALAAELLLRGDETVAAAAGLFVAWWGLVALLHPGSRTWLMARARARRSGRRERMES